MLRTGTQTASTELANSSYDGASFSAAGYAVLIEDDPLEECTSTRNAFAPVAYGSKTFSPTTSTSQADAKHKPTTSILKNPKH